MWSRQILKQKAKERVKANYWKMVLVGVLFFLMTSSSGTAVSSSEWNSDGGTQISDDGYSFDYSFDFGDYGTPYYNQSSIAFTPLAVVAMVIVSVVAVTVAILLAVFVLNPLVLGCRNFFYRNIHEKAKVKELALGFDSNYMNIVKILFFEKLYILLWSLLLVIPGIVKAYEYRMIAYLMAENPNLGKEEAFAISKRMMYGNKWKAFVFDLSFIGWFILGALTGGIVAVFYVYPYYLQAAAMLYDAIKIDDQARYQNANEAYREETI